MEYLGSKGSSYCIIDDNSSVAYTFSDFGKSINAIDRKMAVLECKGILQVNVLSVLGDLNSKVSEVYFLGKTLKVNMNYLSTYAILSKMKLTRANFNIFRVLREDSHICQILVPLKLNTLSLSEISSALGVSDSLWV